MNYNLHEFLYKKNQQHQKPKQMIFQFNHIISFIFIIFHSFQFLSNFFLQCRILKVVSGKNL